MNIELINFLKNPYSLIIFLSIYLIYRFFIPFILEKYKLNKAKKIITILNTIILIFIYPKMLYLSDLGYMIGKNYYLIYVLIILAIIGNILIYVSYKNNKDKLFRYGMGIFLLPSLYILLEELFKITPFITGCVIEGYIICCCIRYMKKFEFKI